MSENLSEFTCSINKPDINLYMRLCIKTYNYIRNFRSILQCERINIDNLMVSDKINIISNDEYDPHKYCIDKITIIYDSKYHNGYEIKNIDTKDGDDFMHIICSCGHCETLSHEVILYFRSPDSKYITYSCLEFCIVFLIL